MVVSESKVLRDTSLELLRLILHRLDGQHFFIVPYGPKTIVLEHKIELVLTIGGKLTVYQLDQAAKDLVLQIREGSFEKFVELPLSCAHDIMGGVQDSKTKMSLRWVSGFDYRDGKSAVHFNIGVEK